MSDQPSRLEDRRSKLRWPLWLWAMQTVPATLLIAYCGWRLENDLGGSTTRWALAAATAWALAVLLALVIRRGRMWLVRRRGDWVLLGIASVAGLAMLDIGLSVSGVVPSLAEQRAYSLTYTIGRRSTYRLVPKTVRVPDGEPIIINSRGFRGPEVSIDKPPDRPRVVFLGGSQVFDYTGGGWPGLAEVEWRRLGLDVEVINAAVPGYNSTDSLESFLTDIWTLRPDLVVVCHGWNDIKYFRRMTGGRPYRELPPPIPMSWDKDWRLYPSGPDKLLTASSLYRYMRVGLISALITEEGYDARGPAPDTSPYERHRFPGIWGPEQFSINLALIAELSKINGALLAVCVQARLERGAASSGTSFEDYARRNTGLHPDDVVRAMAIVDAAVRRVANERRFIVLDMDQALGRRPEYFVDAIHFTPAGSRQAARFVAAQLHDAIAQRAPSVSGPGNSDPAVAGR